MALVGDIKSTLKALLPLLEEKTDRHFLDKALEHYRDARKGLDDLAKPSDKAIHPQYLAQQISHFADEDAIFTCDVGTPTVWAARYLKMNGKRRLLGSFNHGSMANAMPQAIGAKATAPERQVVAMCGDGGFSMLMGDFLSLAQMKLPVKIVIFNNSVLGFVAMEMKAGGYLTDGTELHDTNFARIAEACGIKGIRVEKPPRWMKRCRPPSAPTVRCWSTSSSPKRNWRSRRRSSWSRPKALACNMLRAIISGRGDEGHRTGENQLAQVKQKQYVEPDQGKAVIDLRSDTVTRPGRAMLEAMMAAPVGDDVYGDDPTVNELQRYAADLAGKEAALFLPTGTQANLVGLLSHCQRGEEYIVGQGRITICTEAGGAAVLGSIQPQPIDAAAGWFAASG